MDPFSDQFQIWVHRMDPFHNQVWIQIFIYQSVYNIYNDDGQLIIIIVRNAQTIIFRWKSSPQWWWYAIQTHIYIWMKIIRTIFCASHRINFWASRPTNDQVRPLQNLGHLIYLWSTYLLFFLLIPSQGAGIHDRTHTEGQSTNKMTTQVGREPRTHGNEKCCSLTLG